MLLFSLGRDRDRDELLGARINRNLVFDRWLFGSQLWRQVIANLHEHQKKEVNSIASS